MTNHPRRLYSRISDSDMRSLSLAYQAAYDAQEGPEWSKRVAGITASLCAADIKPKMTNGDLTTVVSVLGRDVLRCKSLNEASFKEVLDVLLYLVYTCRERLHFPRRPDIYLPFAEHPWGPKYVIKKKALLKEGCIRLWIYNQELQEKIAWARWLEAALLRFNLELPQSSQQTSLYQEGLEAQKERLEGALELLDELQEYYNYYKKVESNTRSLRYPDDLPIALRDEMWEVWNDCGLNSKFPTNGIVVFDSNFLSPSHRSSFTGSCYQIQEDFIVDQWHQWGEGPLVDLNFIGFKESYAVPPDNPKVYCYLYAPSKEAYGVVDGHMLKWAMRVVGKRDIRHMKFKCPTLTISPSYEGGCALFRGPLIVESVDDGVWKTHFMQAMILRQEANLVVDPRCLLIEK